MTYTFSFNEEMATPIITIDGARVGIVSFRLTYETKTDKPLEGCYIIIASGYLLNEPPPRALKTFEINHNTKEVQEVFTEQ